MTIIIKPAISPLDRGDLFEEPIEEKLRKEGIGHWVGGGTLVDGSASDVAFKVNDVQKGLAVIRQVLRAKTPPRGIKVTIREESGKEHELEQ